MKTEDRANENLLAIALGEAPPTEHLDRRDAMAELLRRLYSQDAPCTDWGESVEGRLEKLDESIGSLSGAHNEVADEVDALREWADRKDEDLDELHDRVSELKKVAKEALPPAVNQNKDRIADLRGDLSKLEEKVEGGADLGLEHRVECLEEAGDGPMPVAQVMDQIVHHAERAAELTEKALEEDGRQREDWLAAAKIHNQTARALAIVVDHRRAER